MHLVPLAAFGNDRRFATPGEQARFKMLFWSFARIYAVDSLLFPSIESLNIVTIGKSAQRGL